MPKSSKGGVALRRHVPVLVRAGSAAAVREVSHCLDEEGCFFLESVLGHSLRIVRRLEQVIPTSGETSRRHTFPLAIVVEGIEQLVAPVANPHAADNAVEGEKLLQQP